MLIISTLISFGQISVIKPYEIKSSQFEEHHNTNKYDELSRNLAWKHNGKHFILKKESNIVNRIQNIYINELDKNNNFIRIGEPVFKDIYGKYNKMQETILLNSLAGGCSDIYIINKDYIAIVLSVYYYNDQNEILTLLKYHNGIYTVEKSIKIKSTSPTHLVFIDDNNYLIRNDGEIIIIDDRRGLEYVGTSKPYLGDTLDIYEPEVFKISINNENIKIENTNIITLDTLFYVNINNKLYQLNMKHKVWVNENH